MRVLIKTYSGLYIKGYRCFCRVLFGYIYIYMYVYMYMYVCIYIYIYIGFKRALSIRM